MEYRMYGLVPYNLSPIQQGIQFGHALQEYNNKYNDDTVEGFFEWRTKDKTFIILNGGTTNGNPDNLGTLNQHVKTLKEMEVEHATFCEPDLGDCLTAVVFLLDERIWDEKKYPSPQQDFKPSYIEGKEYLTIDEQNYITDIKNMGGLKNWELRKFIKQFRLA